MTNNHESRRFELPRLGQKPMPPSPAQYAIKFLTKTVDYVKTVSIAARLHGRRLQTVRGNQAGGLFIASLHLIIGRIAEFEKTSSRCHCEVRPPICLAYGNVPRSVRPAESNYGNESRILIDVLEIEFHVPQNV